MGKKLRIEELRQGPGGGGREGVIHMKGIGMFIISFTFVNYGFWYHLMCSGRKANIFSPHSIVQGGIMQRVLKNFDSAFKIY